MMMKKFFAAALVAACTCAAAQARADVRARIEGTDLHYEGLTGSDAARRLAELSNRYGKVMRATGIKAE